MNDDMRRAIDIVETGVREARAATGESVGHAFSVLRGALEEALDRLEAGEKLHSSDPEDVFSALDRKSKDIAEDLRRAERLMRERGGAGG